MEDVESTETRSPNNIDFVTFVWRPPNLVTDDAGWQALIQTNPNLFYPQLAKAAFKCDPYFVDVQVGIGPTIRQTAYWYGLFSHKRISSLWKGILMVSLDATQNDGAAIQLLASK